jgi:predicted nuclease of restriction endonuclease-like (RecB) superfamily
MNICQIINALEVGMKPLFITNKAYRSWLLELKARIRRSQIKAAVRVNSDMLNLYWSIGADIVNKQKEHGWGAGIIPQLSHDLKEEFPDAQGYSERNLREMKRFYSFYSQEPFRHQLGTEMAANGNQQMAMTEDHDDVADISDIQAMLFAVPWRHHTEIMRKAATVGEALFYVRKSIENSWSRADLENGLKKNLYLSQGKAPSNYTALLPVPQGSLAKEVLKDPYSFDFLTLADDYHERELENGLVGNITEFLVELGQGFAYVGRQMPIRAGSKELFMDLLFYHLGLRCFVVVELKARAFEAEFMGKLGAYVAAVDDQWRKATDNPTIGLLICKTKDNVYAEYSLRSSSQPIGISAYEVSELLPDNFKSALPSIEEIEAGLSWGDNEKTAKEEQ